MIKQNIKQIFFNSRISAVLLLGFSSGLPLALTSSTLQAWFTQAGVHVVAIGALSLVGLPYVWKFLWAPIMDRFVPPLWGKRRGWILLTQLGLCVALFILANLSPNEQPVTMGFLALLVAFIGASQDIAIDAYRTDVLHPEERGLGMASFIFAFRVALIISGGLALVFADHLGWRLTYELMAVLLASLIVVTYFAPEPKQVAATPNSFFIVVKEAFTDLFRRDGMGLFILFIILYKLGDALALALMSNFLLHGLGFSLTDVGLAYKAFGLVATLLGAFIGGALLIRMTLYRALFLFGIAQALSTLVFMLLAMTGKNYLLMVTSIFIENLCSGMGTTAFLAFLTSLCNQRFSATQYASLSALASIGRVFVGPFAGLIVVHAGWVSLFGWAFVISLPGILLLWFLRNRVGFNVAAVV